ncbi:MAG TPA: alpha-galactosidase, partial [Candidatus Dormibacteraeota bacterium]|nr:alpha-galactosidase [Candidatus Dormibacteraeota bacterium]
CEGRTLEVTPLLVAEGRTWGLPDRRATVSSPLGATRRLRVSWHGRLRLLLDADPVRRGWRLGVRVEALRPLRVDAVGVRVRGVEGTRLLVDGYHSWDWSGVRDATALGRGWWGAMWGDPGDATRLRLGPAATPHAGALSITWDGKGGLDAMCRGEPRQDGQRTGDAGDLGISLAAGASFTADRLEVTNDPGRTGAPAGLPRTVAVEGPRRVGWMSWNCLGAAVRSADALDAAQLVPEGGVVLVDDGWEDRWGDWREAERFGGSIPEIAGKVASAGRELGLWLAPFAIDPDSETATNHPDWLLRDAHGEPVVDDRSPAPMWVLDASRPSAAAGLRTLGVRLAVSGVRVVKTDFLYQGATPGVRAPGWTGMRALVRGLTAFADGFRTWSEPGTAIWACGAPAPAVVGIADACRSGGDAVIRVPGVYGGPSEPPTFVHGAAVVRAQTRNLAARSWLWGAALPCDVDAVTLGRAGDTAAVGDDEAVEWLALARRSRGPLLVSDTADGLEEGRRTLLDETLAAGPGEPERPSDPLSPTPVPMEDDDFLSWSPDLPSDWEPG